MNSLTSHIKLPLRPCFLTFSSHDFCCCYFFTFLKQQYDKLHLFPDRNLVFFLNVLFMQLRNCVVFLKYYCNQGCTLLLNQLKAAKLLQKTLAMTSHQEVVKHTKTGHTSIFQTKNKNLQHQEKCRRDIHVTVPSTITSTSGAWPENSAQSPTKPGLACQQKNAAESSSSSATGELPPEPQRDVELIRAL